MDDFFVATFNTLSILLYPSVLLIVFVILALFCQRRWFANGLLIFAVAIFYLAGNGVLTNYLLEPLLTGIKTIDGATIDRHRVVVILGDGFEPRGGHNYKGLFANARAIEASKIYHQAKQRGIDYTLILSGGNTVQGGQTVAGQLRAQLIVMGVPDDALLLYGASHNTLQSVRYIKQHLDSNKLKQPLVVTSALHMKRAIASFHYFGIDGEPAPADFPMGKVGYLPTLSNQALTQWAVHEYMGRVQLKLYDLLGINKRQREGG